MIFMFHEKIDMFLINKFIYLFSLLFNIKILKKEKKLKFEFVEPIENIKDQEKSSKIKKEKNENMLINILGYYMSLYKEEKKSYSNLTDLYLQLEKNYIILYNYLSKNNINVIEILNNNKEDIILNDNIVDNIYNLKEENNNLKEENNNLNNKYILFDKEDKQTYFISDGDFIKIGESINVKSRLSNLQVANPKKLKLLLKTQLISEKEAHKLFNIHQLNGEWFKNNEFISFFINILKIIQEKIKKK